MNSIDFTFFGHKNALSKMNRLAKAVSLVLATGMIFTIACVNAQESSNDSVRQADEKNLPPQDIQPNNTQISADYGRADHGHSNNREISTHRSRQPIAGLPPERIESARVLASEPIYRTITEIIPRESCWTETISYERYVPAQREQSHAPVVVGGVIGGAIGHAVGHGRSNKNLGAVMGSILGASVGHSVAKQQARTHGGYTDVTYRDEQRCKTVEESTTRRIFDGYDVTYEYQGLVYLTRLSRDPGERLDLAVNVTPLD